MKGLLAVLLLVPVLAACDDDSTSPDVSHVGVYQLQTVDGDGVPASFEEDGGTFTVLEGSISLGANGAFSFEAESEWTEAGVTTGETHTLSGTYTRTGNTLTIVHDGGVDSGFETATLSGDVLTTTGGGDEVLVFEK